MGALLIFAIAAAVFSVLVCCFFAYRLRHLRHGGLDVIVRRLPQPAGRGWHHGVAHYNETALSYFRISSLRPGPDAVFRRRRVMMVSRRPPTVEETVLDRGQTVYLLEESGREFEVAMDSPAATVFLSWLESSPPDRSRRRTY